MIDLLGDEVAHLEALVEQSHRWPDQLAGLTDIIADALAERARPLPLSDRRVAARVVKRLADKFGGTTFYWPKSDSLQRILRDLKIWSEFDGTVDGHHGIHALSRQYHLSPMRIYQILKCERARHREELQPTLPFECDIDKTL